MWIPKGVAQTMRELESERYKTENVSYASTSKISQSVDHYEVGYKGPISRWVPKTKR